MNHLELRRQLLHILYGFALIALHYYGWINESILLGAVIGGGAMSLAIKRRRLHGIARLLAFFERLHHMEQFPGRGIIFFTLGSYLCLTLFPVDAAYGGIAILSVGDAVSNLIGRRYGKIRTTLNPEKCIEGTIAGIAAALPAAYFFFPHLLAVLAASAVGMFLEIPRIRLFGLEIDDNLIIPIGAAFTLTLFG